MTLNEDPFYKMELREKQGRIISNKAKLKDINLILKNSKLLVKDVSFLSLGIIGGGLLSIWVNLLYSEVISDSSILTKSIIWVILTTLLVILGVLVFNFFKKHYKSQTALENEKNKLIKKISENEEDLKDFQRLYHPEDFL